MPGSSVWVLGGAVRLTEGSCIVGARYADEFVIEII